MLYSVLYLFFPACRFSALNRDEGYDQKRSGGGGGMGRSPMGPPSGVAPRRSDSRDKRLTPGGRPPMVITRPSKERDREAALGAAR